MEVMPKEHFVLGTDYASLIGTLQLYPSYKPNWQFSGWICPNVIQYKAAKGREEVSSHFSGKTRRGDYCCQARGGGFLKRNNSWRSCRNKTLHNGCHKLKKKNYKSSLSFYVFCWMDKTEAASVWSGTKLRHFPKHFLSTYLESALLFY